MNVTGLMMLGRQIHTTKPLVSVPQPSSSDAEVSSEKLERNKLPGINQSPVKLIKHDVKKDNVLRSTDLY
jgi:hypothetical protein